MTAPTGRGRLHLAAALDQPDVNRPARYTESARLAESGGLDFVTLDDSFLRPGLDALGVLASVAPATSRIGLVPTLTTTHTEPFHVQAQVATLDWVSRGRAGWRAEVSTTEGEARLFGRRHSAPEERLWHEAGQVVEASRRLWDSWEDDAEIRDTATGRFIDREKLHYADYQGDTFSVKGPSIVPRPPQGHPVTVVEAASAHARRTAARYADVALIAATSPGQAAEARAALHEQARAAGRDPDELRVLASLTVDLAGGEGAASPGHGGGGPRGTAEGPLYRGGPVGLAELLAAWHESGAVDGFHLRPAEPRGDLERLVNGTVALLQHRGLFRTFYPGSTLREHLRLPRPANQYALTGEQS
ncbi:LLM class flavin-dependent oxidoreductase [Streptomyces sp. SCSIO ZS0520]|uniref:LLM class flavin-dependent oxidoreductase n=1 Tax=Streptomyces sp. SCSIO ZS0520 TaxID=2892996 RepID=UPI0021DAEEF9|nr:LLM class flavin-dependent oxidoreductase [Streptomyces sp. SCSIO ZS0520]